jgi:peptidylprolyl isomerase domain and WD repeat-containing protein 1
LLKEPLVKTLETHSAAVRVIRYNAAKHVVMSADDKGIIEYWDPSDYEFPTDKEGRCRSI